MVCGTCRATIAEKAIVCYRCGAATAIPAPPPRNLPPARTPWWLVIALLAVAAVLGWLASNEPPGTIRQVIYGIVGFALLLWSGRLVWRRPRS